MDSIHIASKQETESAVVVSHELREKHDQYPYSPGQENILSTEQLQEVRSFSDGYLRSLISDDVFGDEFFKREIFDREEITKKLSEISISEDPKESRVALNQSICVFLDQLINEFKAMPEDRHEARSALLTKVNRTLFSGDPVISTWLSVAQNINFLTSVYGYPEIWQSVASGTFHEVAYKLEFSHLDSIQFDELMRDSLIQDQVDVYKKLDVMLILGSNVSSRGSTEAAKLIYSFIDNFSKRDERPLVRLYAESMSEHINLEYGRVMGTKWFLWNRPPALIASDVKMSIDGKTGLPVYEGVDRSHDDEGDRAQDFDTFVRGYAPGLFVQDRDHVIDMGILISDLHRSETENKIHQETGIDLKKITLFDQIKFIEFLAGSDDRQIGQLREVLDGLSDADKENYIKSFLSLADNPKSIDAIFVVGELKDKKKRGRILETYAGIANTIYNFETELQGRLKTDKSTENLDRSKITKGLLSRATEMLQNASKGDFSLEDLERYSADLVFFTTTLRELRGELSLEDLRGLIFESSEAESISKEDRGAMHDIYARNYADKPDLQKKLLKGFDEIFTEKETEDNHFHLLKRDDKIISFNRFEDTKQRTSDGRPIKYFGSFNVDLNYRGATIGERVLAKTLEEEAKGSVIEAHCDPEARISQKYINELGFVVTEIIPDYEGTGETIFKIERDDERNTQLKSKEWDIDRMKAEMEHVVIEGPKMQDGIMTIKVNLSDKEQALSTLSHYVNTGDFVITHFEQGADDEVRFVTFELEQTHKEAAA